MLEFVIQCRGIKQIILKDSVSDIAILKQHFFMAHPLLVHDQRYIIAFRCLEAVGLPELGEKRKFLSGHHNLGSVTRIA